MTDVAALLSNTLNYTFANNTLKEYLIAVGVFILAIIILRLFKRYGVYKIKKIAAKSETKLDDVLIEAILAIGWPLYIVLSLLIAFNFLDLPEEFSKYFSYLAIIVIGFYGVKVVQKFVEFGASKFAEKRQEETEEEVDTSIINLLKKIANAVIWVLAVIIVLQNVGINVGGLLAGVGIGGIAIAFALQTLLSDFFACFSIYFDRPFEIGDFIMIGDDMGTVQRVGIKSTRIKTWQGEELIVSNQELTSARVNNYKKLENRRISFTFAVKYDTPPETLRKIPKMVENIAGDIELAKFERAHFKEFGNFGLVFEVAYLVLSSNYKEYLNTQEALNLGIKEELKKQGIEFAYPIKGVMP